MIPFARRPARRIKQKKHRALSRPDARPSSEHYANSRACSGENLVPKKCWHYAVSMSVHASINSGPSTSIPTLPATTASPFPDTRQAPLQMEGPGLPPRARVGRPTPTSLLPSRNEAGTLTRSQQLPPETKTCIRFRLMTTESHPRHHDQKPSE